MINLPKVTNGWCCIKLRFSDFSATMQHCLQKYVLDPNICLNVKMYNKEKKMFQQDRWASTTRSKARVSGRYPKSIYRKPTYMARISAGVFHWFEKSTNLSWEVFVTDWQFPVRPLWLAIGGVIRFLRSGLQLREFKSSFYE